MKLGPEWYNIHGLCVNDINKKQRSLKKKEWNGNIVKKIVKGSQLGSTWVGKVELVTGRGWKCVVSLLSKK